MNSDHLHNPDAKGKNFMKTHQLFFE